MMPMGYAEARNMAAAGPFSFVFDDLRATRLRIAGMDLITAASCVEAEGGALLVWTALNPLEAGEP